MPQKGESKQMESHTNRKPHKPPARRLFISHARVWPIKHSTRQCDGNQSRLKGVPYTTSCSLIEQLVSQSKRISECTEKWVLPLLLWYVSFWLTIFKSKQSWQAPKFILPWRLICLNWLNQKIIRPLSSFGWMAFDFLHVRNASKPAVQASPTRNEFRSGTGGMEWNGMEWNET